MPIETMTQEKGHERTEGFWVNSIFMAKTYTEHLVSKLWTHAVG